MVKPGFVYRIIGIVVLLIGLCFLVIGISYYFDGLDENTEEENKDSGTSLTFFCGLPFILVGLFFFLFGYHRYRKDKPIQDISAILRSYPQVKITKVAKKMGKSVSQTERLINLCIKEGYVRGYIDEKNNFIHDYTFQGMSKPLAPQFAPRPSPPPKAIHQENLCPRCGDPLLVDSNKGLYFCPKCG